MKASEKRHLSLLVSEYVDFAKQCREEGVYSDLFVIEEALPGMRVRLSGLPGEIVTFMSLEYLGIAHLPEIIEAGVGYLRQFGSGFASSRTTIDSAMHLGLEADLADFKRAEACVLTNRGYDASHMLVSLHAAPLRALRKRFPRKRPAAVFMDEFSHASLQDAFASLRGSEVRQGDGKTVNKRYRHADYGELEELLASASEEADRFIVTDGLFSAHGDFADLPELLAIAKRQRACLLVDGAHSDGVYGEEGRGAVEAAGIFGDDLRFIRQSGTLSKAFAGMGGYVTVDRALAELARNSQWNYIFSAGMPMFQAAMYQKTLQVIRGEIGEARRRRLRESSVRLRDTLRSAGFDTCGSSSHVIPVLVGDDARCLEVQRYLVREHGVLCAAFREPAVPKGEAIIRIALSAGHSDAQIEQLVAGLLATRDRFLF